MRKMFLALFFLATSLTAGASLAQDKPADLTPAQQAEARLTLETARNLISYGETKNDALALVVGAKLLASAPGRVLADDQKGAGGADKADEFRHRDRAEEGRGPGPGQRADPAGGQGSARDGRRQLQGDLLLGVLLLLQWLVRVLLRLLVSVPDITTARPRGYCRGVSFALNSLAAA